MYIRLTQLLIVLSVALLAYSFAHAAALEVPGRMQYQHVVNLADGPVRVVFNIVDDTHSLLYSEAQDLDVQSGLISTAIGNGVDPDTGTATGGIPVDIWLPDSARYLEVWIDDQLEEQLLELTTTPYAAWSSRALSVAPAGVTGAAIAEGSITVAHLSEDFFAEFSDALADSGNYGSSGGATSLGVDSNFHYSGAQTVQGVLEDFDRAIAAREEKNVSREGDTMIGKLTIENGGLEVVGNIAVSGTVAGINLGDLQGNVSTLLNDSATHQVAIADHESRLDTLHSSVVGLANSTQNLFDSSLDLLNNHKNSTQAHGSNGAVVGMNTLSSAVGGRVAKSGDTMTGHLNMSGKRVRSLGKPQDNGDAANKAYVDKRIAKSGDTMTGHLNMSGKRVQNLGQPNASGDAVNLGYLETKLATTNQNVANLTETMGEVRPRIVAWGLIECHFDISSPNCNIVKQHNLDSISIVGGTFTITYKNLLSSNVYYPVFSRPWSHTEPSHGEASWPMHFVPISVEAGSITASSHGVYHETPVIFTLTVTDLSSS